MMKKNFHHSTNGIIYIKQNTKVEYKNPPIRDVSL